MQHPIARELTGPLDRWMAPTQASPNSGQPHNVAALAEQFAGGGHHLASGCTLPGPIKVAVDKVRAAFLTMLGPKLQADVVSG